MKIWLSDTGDRSVGIGENVVYMEWNTEYPRDKKGREEERERFLTMFVNNFEVCGIGECVFGDECSSCGAVIGEDKTCLECAKRSLMEAL